MIDFGKTDIEGYGPIDHEVFDWNISGLNILQAPNGYGKTTFINALVWCVYGKPLSGSVERWSHLQTKDYRGVKVKQEVYIDGISILITRYKNYPKYKNSLILEIDGEIPDRLKTANKDEIQREIEELIDYSYDLFKNSIIFGQKLKRIISETGPNKKKVFDEAFQITYLPKAKKIAGNKLTEFKVEEHKREISWYNVMGVVESKKAEIETQKLMIENFEIDKQNQINELNHDLEEKQDEHKELLEKHLGLEDSLRAYIYEKEIFEKDLLSGKEMGELERLLYSNKSKLERALYDNEGTLNRINKLKSDLKNLPEKCPRCGALLDEKKKQYEKSLIQKSLGDEEKQYKEDRKLIRSLKRYIKGVENELSSAQKVQEEYDNVVEQINILETAKNLIEGSKEKIDLLKQEIEKVKNRQLVNNLDDLNLELIELEKKLRLRAKELREVRKDVSAYEWVIKNPLSNSGIKAFVFNLMLDDINERLEFYTKYIGFQVAFFIDMKSAHKNLETYVFIGDNPVPYNDLSGGQQQSVDVATAFAIHDVVAGSKACNLLIMDEIFESLDKDNIEIISEVIQDKAQDRCLWLITHNPEFNPTNSNIVQVSFNKGITSLS